MQCWERDQRIKYGLVIPLSYYRIYTKDYLIPFYWGRGIDKGGGGGFFFLNLKFWLNFKK